MSKKNSMIIIISLAVIAGLIILGLQFMPQDETETKVKSSQDTQEKAPKEDKVIDYDSLNKDDSLKKMMRDRKKEAGVREGVDLILKPGESLKLGGTTVRMKDIIDKIHEKTGVFIEKDILENGDIKEAVNNLEVYGIYVVKQSDNIWNIHFKFLQDYFRQRGVTLSRKADEPDKKGFSSGIGKILKFSENMVHIYSVNKERLAVDLNNIDPSSKIIVYNMQKVLDFLNQIDYKTVKKVRFDGETLWIPAD